MSTCEAWGAGATKVREEGCTHGRERGRFDAEAWRVIPVAPLGPLDLYLPRPRPALLGQCYASFLGLRILAELCDGGPIEVQQTHRFGLKCELARFDWGAGLVNQWPLDIAYWSSVSCSCAQCAGDGPSWPTVARSPVATVTTCASPDLLTVLVDVAAADIWARASVPLPLTTRFKARFTGAGLLTPHRTARRAPVSTARLHSLCYEPCARRSARSTWSRGESQRGASCSMQHVVMSRRPARANENTTARRSRELVRNSEVTAHRISCLRVGDFRLLGRAAHQPLLALRPAIIRQTV